MSSTYFLPSCTSTTTAEKHVLARGAAGSFALWASPTVKNCLILSTSNDQGTVDHIEILKEGTGFKIKGRKRLYSSLEMLILSIRKATKSEAPDEAHAPLKSPRPGRPHTAAEDEDKPADETVIKEMQELFPDTDKKVVVRATTLAEGDRKKAMDLLLSQSIDSQQAKKVSSLSKMLKDVITSSKKKLQGVHKLLMGVTSMESTRSGTVDKAVKALSHVKKLLMPYPGPKGAPTKRTAGGSGAAQLRAWKEAQKKNAHEVIGKLMYMEKQIDGRKLNVKRLVEYGGVLKDVKTQLRGLGGTSDSANNSPAPRKKSNADEAAKERKDSGGAESRNYVIPYNELDMGEVVGKGAYGEVFKAVYQGREVAVKSMALLKDERERNWMKREISLLKQVRHPNVTEFIGISKDPKNNLLIVMEFVSGGELYPVLQDQSIVLDWPLRLKIATDVASALAYMHARNIIHRDIKSENLLVDGDWSIKLCDFGFARAIESREQVRMTMCVPEEHEILTNRGFMDLDAWLAARHDPSLLVASYKDEQVHFERPVQDHVLPCEKRTLVQFESEMHALSYQVTSDHDVFVQQGEVSEPRKVAASRFVGQERLTRATHVALARKGVHVPAERAASVYARSLGLSTPQEREAFLELYGAWLRGGSLLRHAQGAPLALEFGPLGEADVASLRATMERAGLAAKGLCIKAKPWLDFFWSEYGHQEDHADSHQWMASWVWECSASEMRSIARGLGESSLCTSSASFRDEVVRVLLLAGYSPVFQGHCVTWETEACSPCVEHATQCTVEGRVWCLTMPSGLFWVRRARKDEHGVVVEASRAVVTGNCGSPYFNAPELLLGKAYNEKADVFAFGILLCEIITRAQVNLDRLGKKEFNAYALDLEGLRASLPPDCPGPFWKLAVCCCNYDPDKRPSMKQVLRMLKAVASLA